MWSFTTTKASVTRQRQEIFTMMRNGYAGKKLLITGGTGSFGHTVAEKLLQSDVEQIRIFSRDEAKQDAMRHELGDPRLKFYVGDIRDYESIHRATRDVDFIFHAAALKQVPSCEFFPMEAMRTNVLGSDNVVRAADAHGVKSVVCLGTDKAVYPVNAMGMSKALMEKVAQSYGLNNPDTETVVSCVRYGNVMYSRGSVIPLFIRQIKKGAKVTVTDPSMSRFLMSLADSVDLVDFAFHNATQGDLFVKKAPASTIGDLVQAICNLFEVTPDVEVIGTRHAEKLSEALASREELTRAEDMGDYFRIRADNRDLNYKLYFSEGIPEQSAYDDYDSHTTNQLTVPEIEELLLTLPEVRNELRSAGLNERVGQRA
ncbi:polysaccharide biosynthesis protein [Arthrobacter sp. NPDC057009]|uniref:polysaccharide biosynthesis protein n=1 Tax=Arthrobacter sp. NPDC057009 TaxID=3345996 RepID=UPI003641F82A